jgi:CubicO group peptidase (beta-lactamase class C family)
MRVLRAVPVVVMCTMAPAVLHAQSPDASALARWTDSSFAASVPPNGPGCAVGVFLHGRPILAKGYGLASVELGVPISSSTTFPLASLSKQFVGYLIGQLALDGVIDLNAGVRAHVPEMPAYAQGITLRDLLHHTSGIRDYRSLATRAGWPQFEDIDGRVALGLVTRQRGLNFEPRTEYGYSNSNYFLLGLIAERATGRTLDDLMRTRVFAPVGMKHSGIFTAGRVVPSLASAYSVTRGAVQVMPVPRASGTGAGGMHASVEDFAAWERNFVEHRAGSARLDSLTATVLTLRSGAPMNYAFGFGSYEPRPGIHRYSHAGSLGGANTIYVRVPERGFGAVALCNGGSPGPVNPASILMALSERVLPPSTGNAPPASMSSGPPAPGTPVTFQRPLNEFTGRFWSEDLGVVYEFAPHADTLRLTVPGYPVESLRRSSDSTFASQMGVVLFAPGGNAFTLTTDRARHLQFSRAPLGKD